MEKNSNSKIKHVVVLMFENRSFDHLLGDMPGVNGLFDANGKLKKDIYNSTDPLHHSSDPQLPFPIAPGAVELEYIPDSKGAPSFNHAFTAMLTDLYGPDTTAVIDGKPRGNHPHTFPPTNSGFVTMNDFQTGTNNQYSVMCYFKWGSMKVFHKLASEFLVCDNWHCDMPGHTAPNRAFMHCATTGSLGIDDKDDANENYPLPVNPPMVFKPTIFEKLESFDQTWKMYYTVGSNLDTDFLNAVVANQMWTGADQLQTNCTGVPLFQFCADVEKGNLPFYSFIMCFNDVHDTSMHPQAPVEAGENLLAGVYNVLRNSPYWEDTLLVVNFDENGGMYDHVQPLKTKPPYPGVAPDVWYTGGQEYKFDYSILGVRIPVLLISPWLNKGIDNAQFQNTSVVRYLQNKASASSTTGGQNEPVPYLTHRDLHANSIELAFDEFGLEKMRTDCTKKLETYPNTVFADGIGTIITATDEQLAAPPPAYLEELTKEYIGGLPGHPDSGKPITRHFATISEMRAYVAERRAAARADYKKNSGEV